MQWASSYFFLTSWTLKTTPIKSTFTCVNIDVS